MDIGEGCKLTVVPADFGKSSSAAATTSSSSSSSSSCFSESQLRHKSTTGVGGEESKLVFTAGQSLLSTVQVHEIDEVTVGENAHAYNLVGADDGVGSLTIDDLPKECQADQYPVVVIGNAYDPIASRLAIMAGTDATFFGDLEAELLLECCKFGKIVRLFSPEEEQWEGFVLVTFESIVSAKQCESCLHGRWFDGRRIIVQVTVPPKNEWNNNKATPHSIPPPPLPPKMKNPGSVESKIDANVNVTPQENVSDENNATDEAADVDDFLNSLL